MVGRMLKHNKPAEPIQFQSSRTGMYFLLAGLVVVLLPHISHLPLWTTLSCFCLVMWRLLYEQKRLPLPNRLGIYLIFALIIIGVLASYFTIVGREAGTALLISLICLKLLEIKSLRDISLIVQLAFFAIVITFLFSQSIFVAVSMLVALVLLITSLISYQHAKTTQNRQPDDEKSHLLLAVKMLLYAVPLTIVIFIFFPRTNVPLWGLPHDAFSARTGLSNSMTPGEISNLVNNDAVAFRVKFHSRVPAPAKRYWRGPVFWKFDGRTWSAPETQRLLIRKIPLVQPTDPVEYTVTLEPENNYWLFALDQPGIIPPDAFMTTEMQLLSRKPIHHLLRYRMKSYLRSTVPWIGGLPAKRYLQVPKNAAPRARAYIKKLMQRYPDKTNLIKAVLNRFRNKNYFYTRHPPQMSGDPTDAFLFDTKRGYCEHYASSFTVLMRLAGIPARVVTGYQGGEMNPLSNYMIVRQSDAHAWSEIYLKNKGWVRIDPTAVIPPSNIEDAGDIDHFRSELTDSNYLPNKNWFTESVRQLQYAWDLVNNSWNQWVIGYNNQSQKSLFRAIGIPEITWLGLSYVLFSTLGFFIILIAHNIFQSQRIKRTTVDKIYQRFLKKLRPFNIQKSPTEGALSFAQRVANKFPGQAPALMHIATLYNQARYANAPSTTLNDLNHAVQTLKFSVKL